MMVSWGLTIAIIMFILIIRTFSQPLRGLIDMGVVLGLTYGVITLLFYSWKAFTDDDYNHPPELPENTED